MKAPIDVLGLSNGARSGADRLRRRRRAQQRSPRNGVTINGLLPGVFDTDRVRTMGAAAAQRDGKTIEEIAAARQRNIPARRYGTADEFGAICAFLCSVHAAYITGQNLLVDGGAYPGTY